MTSRCSVTAARSSSTSSPGSTTIPSRVSSQPITNPFLKKGPTARVSTKQALPLAMILLEWFTNSGKYGAHSRPTGRVFVAWERVAGIPHAAGLNRTGPNGSGPGNGRAAGDWVRLHWRESGGPPIHEREPPTSLGTELVKGFAALELRGRFEARYRLEGVDYLLEFPVLEQEQEPLGVSYPSSLDLQPPADSVPGSAPVPAVPSVVIGASATLPDRRADLPPSPLSEPDPAPSRVRSRATRRRR